MPIVIKSVASAYDTAHFRIHPSLSILAQSIHQFLLLISDGVGHPPHQKPTQLPSQRTTDTNIEKKHPGRIEEHYLQVENV